MAIFKKTYWLIYPSLIVVFMLLADRLFPSSSFLVKAFASGILAFILSPRKKRIEKQQASVYQITWIFLKKPIVL